MSRALPAVVVLLMTLAACTAPSTAAVTVGPDTIVLDVRTPQEHAEGHLEGAQLLDLSGGQFAAALPGLDPQAEYVVYCRSGNRSGQAVALMEEAGFANVTDLGSLEDAADATGVTITR